MRDDHRQCIFMLGTHVNEMNVEPVDFSDEVRHGVDLGLALPPIVLVRPILRELLHRRQLHALCGVGDLFALWPLCGLNALAQIGEVRLRRLEVKRTNSGVVTSLLGGWLCSSGLGHGLLLLNSFGFRICECLGDRPWAERDCQTQHRTLLEKATARSLLCLFHRVLLSGSSGFWVVWSSSQ